MIRIIAAISFDTRDGKDIDTIGLIDTDEGVLPFSTPISIKDDVEKVLYTYHI